MSLADALAHVRATEIEEAEAKRQIAAAIADGGLDGVMIRATLNDGNVTDRAIVPSHLGPDDLDWEQSRAKQPWKIEDTVVQAYMGGGYSHPMTVVLIEISRDNVERIWPDHTSQNAVPAVSHPDAATRKNASNLQREQAIRDLYSFANASNMKPPNVLEVATAAVELLASRGVYTSRNALEKIARDKFAGKRLKSGHRPVDGAEQFCFCISSFRTWEAEQES